MRVWLFEGPGYYTVMVDGVAFETLWLRKAPLLTWSQQANIADNYREALQEAPYLLNPIR